MKKSLIALAVAGAFAAPAFAASSNVDIYGQVRVSIDNTNHGVGTSVNDEVSRVGIKGSEDLGGGLKAIWQWESQLNNTGGSNTKLHVDGSTSAKLGGALAPNTADTSLRNTFVGLSGGFGTVLAGTHDSPYKLGGSADIFADTAADSQRANTGIIGRNGFDTRANNATAYISPDWSGFHFAAAGYANEQTLGAGTAKNLWDAQSVVGVYVNGPLKVTGGYENYGKKMVGGAHDKNAYKLNGAYKIGDIGLGLTYEASRPDWAAGSKRDVGMLGSLTFGMGPITLGAQYGKFNDKNGVNDLTRTTVGAYYDLSKRTQTYLAYNHDNNQTAQDFNTLTVGLNHNF